MYRPLRIIFALLMAVSCGRTVPGYVSGCRYAEYFDLTDSTVVLISPYDGSIEVVPIVPETDNIICMSSSHVACLAAVGADSLISAVSGLKYLNNESLHTRGCVEVGYEGSLDYQKILTLKTDVVTAYTVSSSIPQYLTKLESIGVNVLVLYDHLERHPLARAEYVRLFGALTGRRELADSLFDEVCSRYVSLADKRSCSKCERKSVLMNIPYGGAWYVPSRDSYLARIVSDAGGEVLGAGEGSSSTVITMEQAYEYSQKADIWLNPGYCRTRGQLLRLHQLFPYFGPLANGRPVYNNTLKVNPEGGNDFFESGAVRPDLVLEDLIRIMETDEPVRELNYFMPL